MTDCREPWRVEFVSVVIPISANRGSSPAVREGVRSLEKTPFLTVGLLPRFFHSFDNPARRSSFDKRQANYASTRRFDFFAPMNFVQRVISALYQNVGE